MLVNVLIIGLVLLATSTDSLRHHHFNGLIDDEMVVNAMKLPLLPEFITKRDGSKTYDEFVDSLSVFLNKPYIRAAPQPGKHIPRILWLAVKNSSEELPSHMLELFARNKDWQVNIVGNEDKDRFIDTVFSNTSVQVAYHLISPLLGAAKADIWRYSVLWLYGGVYVDYDSDIKTLFDDIISNDDEVILSEEGINYEECYLTSSHLSNNATFSKHNNYKQILDTTKFIDGLDSVSGHPRFFHGKYLLNWAIFSSPFSSIFEQTLENGVKLIFSEYFNEKVVFMAKHTPRFKLLLCSTTYLLTTSLRQALLENKVNSKLRIVSNDFKEYGGKCKAIWTGNDASNYRKVMGTKHGHDLLRTYSSNMTRGIRVIEGWPISSYVSGKSLFLVENGRKRQIGDMDTFTRLGFDLQHVLLVSDDLFNALPVGPAMQA